MQMVFVKRLADEALRAFADVVAGLLGGGCQQRYSDNYPEGTYFRITVDEIVITVAAADDAELVDLDFVVFVRGRSPRTGEEAQVAKTAGALMEGLWSKGYAPVRRAGPSRA